MMLFWVQVTLIALKMFGAIGWSWPVVLVPFWLWGLFWVVALLGPALGLTLKEEWEKVERRRRAARLFGKGGTKR